MSKGRERKLVLKRTYQSAFKNGGTVTCVLCGKPIRYYSDLTIDHLIPQSKGGGNVYDNLAPAHYQCNQAKKDTLLLDLVYEKERL